MSDWFIRFDEVQEIGKLSRTSIYAKIADGSFPAPVKIGRASRWSAAEIRDWIESTIQARDEGRNTGRHAAELGAGE